VLLGLGAFALLAPSVGEAAFGIGLAVSAVPHFALGLYGEAAPLRGFPQRGRSTLLRYALAGVGARWWAAVAAPPRAVAAVLSLCGVVLLPGSTARIWRMLRGAPA
jgi:hypothetical protein